MDMESATAGTHVNSSWTHGVLSVKEIIVFQACVVVNVKTGGMFFENQLLSSACRALVRGQAPVQRGGACARWTRTVVFLPFCGHTVMSSFVIALSVVVSCATDLMTSHAWLK